MRFYGESLTLATKDCIKISQEKDGRDVVVGEQDGHIVEEHLSRKNIQQLVERFISAPAVLLGHMINGLVIGWFRRMLSPCFWATEVHSHHDDPCCTHTHITSSESWMLIGWCLFGSCRAKILQFGKNPSQTTNLFYVCRETSFRDILAWTKPITVTQTNYRMGAVIQRIGRSAETGACRDCWPNHLRSMDQWQGHSD